MLKRMKAFVCDKSGSALVGGCIGLLCLAMLTSVALEYHQTYIIAVDVEEMVRKATVTMAVNNSYNAYTGVRDARGNAYGADGEGGWTDISNITDVKRQLRKLFDFKVSGDKLTNTNRSGVEFVLDIRSIDYVNELSDEDTLEFDVTYTLDVPMRFMGEPLFAAKFNKTTRATYIKKY